MEPGCLPFSEIPQTTRLFTDFTSNFERVSRFYRADPQAWMALGRRSAGYPEEMRRAVTAVLERQNRSWNAHPHALKNIERMRKGANAVVTGQQVGLFGGPAFSFYKAASVIRLARELTARGHECVPIFWLATEDHDFKEVSSALLRSPAGELGSAEIASTAKEGTPVGRIQLGAGVNDALQKAEKLLGKGEMLDVLRECYQPQHTLGGAIAKLFAALFSESGLVLIDPSDLEFHRLAEPSFGKAAMQSRTLGAALLQRGKELESAGYHQQVKVTASTTLLFAEIDGVRTPIRQANGGFDFGGKRMEADEFLKAIEQAPERFTGNALLRPVVQDYLLPTIAYIGGPAEVAYFAQCDVVYRELLGAATPIRPRMSATLLDARDSRLLRQYGMHLTDLLRARDLDEMLAGKRIAPDITHQINESEAKIQLQLEGLRGTLQSLDPSVAAAAETVERKIRYQLSKLRGKIARAEARRNQEIGRHADALRNSLLPNGHLQERQIAGISYVARYGRDLLDRLIEAASPDCIGHQMIEL